MTHALTAKNKIGFINESIEQLSEKDQPTEYVLWNQCNNMILSWLTHSIEPDLAKGVIHAKTAYQIRMHDDIVRTLTDVRHVPELRKNLISLGTLDSNGCSYRAVGGVMRIMKGALVVMKGLKQNSLYLLHGSTIIGTAAAASSSDIDSDTTKLWHMRLGHMSERGMDVLSKQSLLGSKKIGKLNFCQHCVFGKQCRKELIDAGKDHGVREKVELEVRAPDSLPIIPTDEDDGSHSTEQNEEPQEQHWKATLQTIIALSTTEVEYIATTEAVKEAIWLKGLVEVFEVQPQGTGVVAADDNFRLFVACFIQVKVEICDNVS
ncbi:hypothetical protein RJ639_020260 [Escallonia herrerae]|uniref:GAG-pre-integrase domain-containing protein n=1 Tax=Escallonia herrerae TaxID=1293975 RepID=A0AA88V503_9ASTE|nr:hypothetical protein RJ639_020260 [Escallonia herrerae]